MKRFLLTIAFFLISAAACDIVYAKPVTLRYKTSPGDVFYFSDESTTTGSVRFLTKSGKLLNEIPFDRKSDTITRMDTEKVKNGAATILIHVEKYRMTDNGALTVDFDVEKGKKQLDGLEGDLDFLDPYSMTIDERGNVLGFKKLAKGKSEIKGKFDWKKLGTVMQIWFPKGPVEVGDKWTNTVDMKGGAPSPLDIKGVKRNFKLLGFKKMKGLDCAKIRFDTVIENAAGLAQELLSSLPADAGAKIESSSLKVGSDVYFARDEGILVALESVVSLRMNLTMNGPADGNNERVMVEGFFETVSAYELE